MLQYGSKEKTKIMAIIGRRLQGGQQRIERRTKRRRNS